MLQLCCDRGYPNLAMNAKPARSDASVSNTAQYFGTHARSSIFELTISLGAHPDSLQCNNCLVSDVSLVFRQVVVLSISGINAITYNCIQRRDQTCHFSQTKRKLKVKDNEEPSSRSGSSLWTELYQFPGRY